MRILAYYLFILLSLALNCFCQQRPTHIRPLTIGDTLPDLAFGDVINYHSHSGASSAVKLSDFRGKLVILDFWATWCSACIHNFPTMQALQTRFNGKVQIIGITSEDQQKAARFLTKYAANKGQPFTIPSATNAAAFNAIFPHKIIPHYVWIDSVGAIIAITDSQQVTEQHIQSILNGQPIKLPLKADLMDFDHNRPLFVNGNGGNGTSIQYRSLLSGPIPGMGRMASSISDESKRMFSRIFGINCTIPELYAIAYTKAADFPKSRIILDVKEPSRLRYTGSMEAPVQWKDSNTYCYEYITRPVLARKIKQQMAQDLNRYLGLTARFEKRLLDCWVLTATQDIANAYTKGGAAMDNLYENDGKEKYLHNKPVAAFIEYLNSNLPLFTLDETGCTHNLDLQLPADLSDIPSLQQALHAQGLNLTMAKREIEVFVITDK